MRPKVQIIPVGLDLNSTADLIENLINNGIDYDFVPIPNKVFTEPLDIQILKYADREEFIAIGGGMGSPHIDKLSFATALIHIEREHPDIEFKISKLNIFDIDMVKAEHEYKFYNRPSKEEIRDKRQQDRFRQKAHRR